MKVLEYLCRIKFVIDKSADKGASKRLVNGSIISVAD